MESLRIIAEALGLSLTKRPTGYLINKGYTTSGIIFPELESVAKHLAKEIKLQPLKWENEVRTIKIKRGRI